MDPINNTQQSVPEQAPMSTPPSVNPDHKKVGPIVAIAAVVLILIIGALYMFASRMDEPMDDASAPRAETVQPVTSTSDDIDDIEADLDMSIDGLDSQNF
ncbi:MAG: hypothetical protein KBC33_03830 [Candidatus Pacebacteria bacterium]|nr:hypothetical protein [Candidatus Paceibacterota bacterium]